MKIIHHFTKTKMIFSSKLFFSSIPFRLKPFSQQFFISFFSKENILFLPCQIIFSIPCRLDCNLFDSIMIELCKQQMNTFCFFNLNLFRLFFALYSIHLKAWKHRVETIKRRKKKFQRNMRKRRNIFQNLPFFLPFV